MTINLKAKERKMTVGQHAGLYRYVLVILPKAKIRGHRDMPGTIPKACPCLDAGREFGWLEGLV